MKNFLFVLTCFSVFFISCNESSEIVTPNTEETKLNVIHVDESGYKFDMIWPAKLKEQKLTPKVKYNETSGVLEILAGKSIQIEVTDQSSDLVEYKSELSEDQLFSYNFHDVTPNGYIFQAVLPDGTEYFYNFIEQKTVGNKTYEMKNKEGEFTLANVKLMKEISASLK